MLGEMHGVFLIAHNNRTGMFDYRSLLDDDEIADALAQKADVPFRIGHHFASQLTDYGRGRGLKIQDIPYAEPRAFTGNRRTRHSR